MKIKLFWRLLVLGLMVIIGAACDSEKPAQPEETIRVATDASFPPFEYIDEDTGELLGFDIDLMNALAERVGIGVEFENIPWDDLQESMEICQHDAYISAMPVREYREGEEICYRVYEVGPNYRRYLYSYCASDEIPISYSNTYFPGGLVVVVGESNSDILGYQDLKGKNVSVEIGILNDDEASEIVGSSILLFSDSDSAFRALANNDAEAVIDIFPRAFDQVTASDGSLKIVGEHFNIDSSYAIAVCNHNPDLLTALNTALGEVMDDGTYDELYNKWFTLEK